MNHVFQPRGFFTVPDGTEVSAFLNATDTMERELPWTALGAMSIAAGRVRAKSESWVHIHPVVTQVTYLLAGELTLRMKETSDERAYDLELQPRQAAVALPGTALQLRNQGSVDADVLYLVSPSYVFEIDGRDVRYDDARLVARTWEELEESGYDLPSMKVSAYDAGALREEAVRRLALRCGHGPRPLSEDRVCSLNAKYDYLAPDGSEIRLLVTGERGGLAHCVLPKGHTSAPVRHRTVEELWYVIEGVGEIWRGRDGETPRVDSLRAGDSVRIPVGVAFQFRASPDGDLKLLLATAPPWPGPQEAVSTPGHFEV